MDQLWHRDNFIKVFNQATERDIAAAKASYPKYQRLCREMARKYGFGLHVGAGVFAALSPNNDYWGNLRDADKLMAAAAAGKSIDDFTVSTYGNNKLKAWRITKGEEPEELIVALKTRNFYENIFDPRNPQYVTIDGHMHNVYYGTRHPLQSRDPNKRIAKVAGALYYEIASQVMAFSFEKDMLPCEMQGVLWITWRRIHGIHSPKQQELWDRDYHAANLGFVCS